MRETELGANPSVSRVSPSTAWSEKHTPDEEKLFEDFANRVIAAQQKENARPDGTLMRGFHAKSHAGLVAEFKILNGLPDYARFGVFSEPRIFPAVVRFSNSLQRRQSDKRLDPRGMAIKLIGIPGDKGYVTQDFLATSRSVISTARNTQQFMAFVEAGRKGGLLPVNLARAVGTGEAVRMLYAIVRSLVLRRKVRSVATEEYSGGAPIKLGPYAVVFTVRPSDGTKPPARLRRTANFLQEELTDRLRKGDVIFDFVLQFYVDEERTPIEDNSVLWKPEHTPFLTVAQLRIPSCNLDDPLISARSQVIDRYLFSPWHYIEEHRPLGNINRARLVTYQVSATLRGHSPEPTSLPD